MKKELFFLLMSIFLHCNYGCKTQNDTPDMVKLQPGHFCQLGAIAIVGDTIFLAGSYITEENPNLAIQPVYSYLAAIHTDGSIIWEQTPKEPDYICWEHLSTTPDSIIYTIGVKESPIEGHGFTIYPINTATGQHTSLYIADKNSLSSIKDIRGKEAGMAILRTQMDNESCVHAQFVLEESFGLDATISYCNEGKIQLAKFANPMLDYYATFGTAQTTNKLVFVPTLDSIRQQIPLPKEMEMCLVNDLLPGPTGSVYLASTAKNAQGPCLWQINTTDSASKHICLSYWPFHGNTIMLAHGPNTLLAFNAANDKNDANAHIVMLNAEMEIVWEQQIDSQHPFMIKTMATDGHNIYLAGTLEMGSEGSALAIKVLPLPEGK